MSAGLSGWVKKVQIASSFSKSKRYRFRNRRYHAALAICAGGGHT